MRPIKKCDLKYIQSWINDPEVQFFAQEEYPYYFNAWLVRYIYSDGLDGKKMIFMVEDKKGNIIGEIWLYPIDYTKKSAELVITIGRKELRGKGYGRDVINTIKRYCFEELKLDSIYLKVFAFNTRAIRCYKSCGFNVIGRIPQKVIRNGIRYDELVMETIKEV
jgi:RimJ/RimL family protein N-acetyltransferase